MSGPGNGLVPVLIFARAPVAGQCKTRLIPCCGRRGSALVHRQLVRRTLNLAQTAACGPVELWATPTPSHPFFASLRRETGVSLRRQPGGDLGRRMSHALARVLLTGAPAALLLGTDAANLSTQDLRVAAQTLLDGADVVLQPAADGGYVLLGLNRAIGSTLRGVEWSSGRELRQTCARLRRRGLNVVLLAERWDIDRPTDLRRARREGLLRAPSV